MKNCSRERQYVAIDLKSFYASVECVERGLNPLDACLVVADESRTDKTICLAVSPALKSYGVAGRPRLFEVVRKVNEVNRSRGRAGRSTSGAELASRHDLAVDYIVASPRMQLYINYSARIYGVYLRYVAPEDIHVYSIDEVFIDVTPYLKTYRMTAHQLAMTMIRDVLKTTGITATAGIGTNLYLCKVAMDIVAKKMPADKDGVRIAELDEPSYRRQMWSHTPLTDFWRIGAGTARRLESAGLHTMGDVARASIAHEDWFFKRFGINAELLIDHAWGREPVAMESVKTYCPASRSMSRGQVLTQAYSCDMARTVISEMADSAALELVEKRLVTRRMVMTIGYDSSNLANPDIKAQYEGRIRIDHYGRPVPYHSRGTSNFDECTSSSRQLIEHATALFDRIVNPSLLIRRLSISLSDLRHEADMELQQRHPVQLQLFTDYEATRIKQLAEERRRAKERMRQETIISLRRRYGKNAVLKGLNYSEGATQRERNRQIGGHKAW